MTAVPPRPSAPDATAGDGLREAIAERDLLQRQLVHMTAERDGLTHKLRDALAAAARDAEKVRLQVELARIEGRAEGLNGVINEVDDDDDAELIARRAVQWEQEAANLRRALDPS